MNERWVCKRCFADNEESDAACVKCGLPRGAEAGQDGQEPWAPASATTAPTEAPAWRRWIRFWWVPALIVVLAVGYLGSARRGDDGALQGAGTLNLDDLRAGDCFNSGDETEIADVDGVPCGEPHEYQVFAVGRHESASLPSDAEMETVFRSVCEGPFGTFVGEPYATSALWATMITPSQESWDDGDRTYICVLYDPEDAALTESMEGAGR